MKVIYAEMQELSQWLVSKTCLLVGCSEETWLCDLSQSDTESKLQYAQTGEKAGSCALRCLFNNTFQQCDNSHLICVFECHVSACKLQNFLLWKKDLHKCPPDRMWLSQNIWLKSGLLNLTGTLKRSHSEVLMWHSFCALCISLRTKETLRWWQVNIVGKSSSINRRVVQIPMLKVKIWVKNVLFVDIRNWKHQHFFFFFFLVIRFVMFKPPSPILQD